MVFKELLKKQLFSSRVFSTPPGRQPLSSPYFIAVICGFQVVHASLHQNHSCFVESP
ncbi:hypothetical Protein YC6258_03059 [Gynuella sunshinyii YC6258]|uniref:Uncharacterized protein n=1 Tax=Gynuella sunshinyii YC6258 TaxID=1445510 RepID=A0A0C5V6M3_9GAMM|nr:hypothetical Protein YC6258_03059 [Gynuella sunshinyii YC6258]